jgi:nucleotide-binding universal stress UspA family protein
MVAAKEIGGVMNGHTIVVGVDGSDHSKAALTWAVEEAALRGARVRALHAWQVYPALHPGTTITARDFDEVRAQADSFVKDFVAEVVPDHDGVEIEAVAVQGQTVAPALIDAAADADLLVVGSRGLGGFRGLLLGSVSQQCVHHATCPVVVLPRPVTQ